jgi:hypothetical protein
LAYAQPPAGGARPGTEAAAAIAAAYWESIQPGNSGGGQISGSEPSRWKLEGRRSQLDRQP